MKILVNATALDSRGGYVIIRNFLEDLTIQLKYLENNGIFIKVLVSNSDLLKFNREPLLSVEYNPSPKVNLFRKLVYERLHLPRYITNNKFNYYLSLQNLGLFNVKIPQYCLIHQPIPFSNLSFSELELKNWIKYKVVLSLIYKMNLKSLDGIFVQTNWMANSLRKNFKYNKKIIVSRPKLSRISNNTAPLPEDVRSQLDNDKGIKLLYVTNYEKYKNNTRLIKAIEEYNKKNSASKITLYLTIEGNNRQNIKYIGKIDYQSIYTLYKSVDALIFPSLTETLGLPILEAMQSNIDILIANEPYAKELCGNNAIYFNGREITSITEAINTFVNKFGNKASSESKLTDYEFNYINYIKEMIE